MKQNHENPSSPPAPQGAVQGAALARIRHELRTPLNAIIGYSEILLEDAADSGLEEIAKPLERIHRSGIELLALIQEHVRPTESGGVPTLWSELRTLALGPLDAVLEASSELLEAVRSRAPEMVPDIEKISSSGGKLRDEIEVLVEHSSSPEIQEAPPPSAGEARARPAEAPKPASRAHGSVLVVDDRASNREVLSRRLDKLGYQVTLADGGQAALEKLAEGGFDVVLLDVLMPDMDGYEVLRKFKEDDASGHVPVIMISALDELKSVAQCIEMGAEDYLPKPFDPMVLSARVGSSVEKKKLRDKELLYLRDVAFVTRAASDLELGRFSLGSLSEVEKREDELGHLARVFRKMAGEVQRREESLKKKVAELKIEIDQARTVTQVEEITDSEYFRSLQAKARSLRRRIHEPVLPTEDPIG